MVRRGSIVACCFAIPAVLLAAQAHAQYVPEHVKNAQDRLRKQFDEDRMSGTMEWGELHYGRTYKFDFVVRNECSGMQRVSTLFVDLPYLTIEGLKMPADVISVPPGETKFPATITTPPPPNIPPQPFLPQLFPHGIYEEFIGGYRLDHAYSSPPPCKDAIDTVKVTGHIHYDPNPDPGGGPERIAHDVCATWWNTGERPPGADDAACLDKIRGYASQYRELVLQRLADEDPVAWAWLPSVEAIGGMPIPELLSMKDRAGEQMAGSG